MCKETFSVVARCGGRGRYHFWLGCLAGDVGDEFDFSILKVGSSAMPRVDFDLVTTGDAGKSAAVVLDVPDCDIEFDDDGFEDFARSVGLRDSLSNTYQDTANTPGGEPEPQPTRSRFAAFGGAFGGFRGMLKRIFGKGNVGANVYEEVKRVLGEPLVDFLRRYTQLYQKLSQIEQRQVALACLIPWGVWLIMGFFAGIRAGSRAWVAGLPLGLTILTSNIVITAWWIDYRRSRKQLRHQILGRDSFARGREIEQDLGGQNLVDKAGNVRPQFTKAVAATGRDNIVKQQLIDPVTKQPRKAYESLGLKAKWSNAPELKKLSFEPIEFACSGCHNEHHHNTELDLEGLSRSQRRQVQRQVNRQNRKSNKPLPEDVGLKLGKSNGVEVWLGLERPCYLCAAPRSGKGIGVVINAIINSPGAVITTSTRTDNMELTIAARAKRGPVAIFNIDKVGNRPHSIEWTFIEGCGDAEVAKLYAATLVASSGLGGDNQVWATSSGGIVQALLYAAAISGSTASDVYAWSRSAETAKRAMKILENEPDVPGKLRNNWHLTIEAVNSEDPKMKGSKWFGVENAFAGLAVAETRELLNAKPGSATYFDTEEFLRSGGTVYMIARGANSAKDTAGTSGGFYSLFLDHVTRIARKISQENFGGRLDPPLTIVADELANIHPWPAAARMMSAGSGEGIQLIVVFQSREQAVEAYGENVEFTMWASSTNLILGGGEPGQYLGAVCKSIGEIEQRKERISHAAFSIWDYNISEDVQNKPGITEDELRRLTEHTGLLIDGRTRPVLVDLTPYWLGSHAQCIAASKTWHQDNPGKVITTTPPQLLIPIVNSADTVLCDDAVAHVNGNEYATAT